MDKWEAILQRALGGRADRNVRFADLCGLLDRLGYAEHTKGEHHVFRRAGRRDIIDIQPQHEGKAKSYQVRQIRALLRAYGITRMP